MPDSESDPGCRAAWEAPRARGWACILGVLALLVWLAPSCLAQAHGAAPASGALHAAAPASDIVALPPARPEIVAYNRQWYALYFLGVAWHVLGLFLILRTRAAARLRDAAERLTRRRLAQSAVVYAPLSLALALWMLPVALSGYGIDRAHGFETQPLAFWLLDRGKAYLLGLPTILAVWIGSWLLERSPKRWWLWLWAASIPWNLAMTVLYPVWVAPRFDNFRPLGDTRLRGEILALAAKAGIEHARVYEVDISRRTTKLNAYVTGLGPTARIVVWDTTLKTLSDDEVLAIVGHEIGHYVLRHVWREFLFGIAGALAILWLLARILPTLVARRGSRYGIRALHDLAALPLFLLALYVILVLQTPVASALSRYNEHEADAYGLRLTHLNTAMARAFVAFVRHDYADPDPPPFIVFWFYTHPPLRERVDFALHYRP